MSPPIPGEGRFLLSVPYAAHGAVTRMQISDPAPQIHELLGEFSRLSVTDHSPSSVAPLEGLYCEPISARAPAISSDGNDGADFL
jgi:hypothetical protein